MKRSVLMFASLLTIAIVVWAAVDLAIKPADPARLLPDGALLYIQAKDFQGLLADWSSSKEKRSWLKGDDYAAFSRSRLFERLAQAQGEFSTAATIPADDSLLGSVAGQQSALALYDIGNLEFVYITRMDQARIERTPLWQLRNKFEQRMEGNSPFFVRQDATSNRTASFATRDGWLILGTRADLVAGVLDRLQGAQTHSLADESWYADPVKLARGPAADLRMSLNLEAIVPSPYFRSYWIQRNITELKQYRAAICDLRRSGSEYREERTLLRKAGGAAVATGDVQALIALVPEDAVFSSALASPGEDRVIVDLRENILELKPERARAVWSAPSLPQQGKAGAVGDLEERIDVAPVIVAQTDPYESLRRITGGIQPSALLNVYTTHAKNNQMFAAIDRGIVIQAANAWNNESVQNAITAAIRPGLTVGQIGASWSQRTGPSGSYVALDGQVQIYLAAHEKRLFVATSETLLQALLLKDQQPVHLSDSAVTYAAVFQHSQNERQKFGKIVNRLDGVHGSTQRSPESGEQEEAEADSGTPPFFSGNIAALSRTFSDVARESIEERDQGERVTQTVIYQWNRQ